jgi:hypothetical protein
MTSVRALPELPTAAPEHALLLAAVRASGEETRRSIEEALSRSPDWTRLIQLALHHRMTPALLAALECADSALVPADLLAALRQHCGELRAQSDALIKELFELLDALGERSVFAIPFKGPLLGELLFDDAGMRAPGDLDLLVHPDNVSRFCEVLEGRGYVDAGQRPGVRPLTVTQQSMYRRFQCEHTYVRASDGVVVEPHWALSQRPLAVDIDYAGMLRRARPRSLGGRAVLALAPEDLLLALCIHGAKHHWERLAWIRDVAALITSCADLNLVSCIDRARPWGCVRLLLVGLAVAHRCAGVNLPLAVERLIDADRCTVVLEQQVLGWLFDPHKEPPANDRLDRYRFLTRERWSDRIRYVSRTLLSPRRNHLEIVALPRALMWLYFPLKLGHDFVALPLWRFVKRPIDRADRRSRSERVAV